MLIMYICLVLCVFEVNCVVDIKWPCYTCHRGGENPAAREEERVLPQGGKSPASACKPQLATVMAPVCNPDAVEERVLPPGRRIFTLEREQWWFCGVSDTILGKERKG